MDFRLEQEGCFRLLVLAQEEDRRVILSLLVLEVAPDAVSTILHVLINTDLRLQGKVINLVVLEQFIVQLQCWTAEWVQCHHPT